MGDHVADLERIFGRAAVPVERELITQPVLGYGKWADKFV